MTLLACLAGTLTARNSLTSAVTTCTVAWSVFSGGGDGSPVGATEPLSQLAGSYDSNVGISAFVLEFFP